MVGVLAPGPGTEVVADRQTASCRQKVAAPALALDTLVVADRQTASCRQKVVVPALALDTLVVADRQTASCRQKVVVPALALDTLVVAEQEKASWLNCHSRRLAWTNYSIAHLPELKSVLIQDRLAFSGNPSSLLCSLA
jgi:hypothetical protein